jgi:hypothetical protein
MFYHLWFAVMAPVLGLCSTVAQLDGAVPVSGLCSTVEQRDGAGQMTGLCSTVLQLDGRATAPDR